MTLSTAQSDHAEKKRQYIRHWQARSRDAAREVGPIDEIEDPVRRESTRLSFPKFCETYFPAAFTLPWSENHLLASDRIEQAVLQGGLFAFAMPRGSGKTTMCEWAAMWALLHSHHLYVLLIGATESKAKERLKSVQVELTSNYLLRADFPEIIQPIHHLGTSKKQADYQTQNGVPTAMSWTTERVIFPTIFLEDGSTTPASGGIVQVAGITGGEIRGCNHKRQDGSIIRPTLAVCDDPQTRESAKSPTQSDTRTQTLAADVAYCAGPGSPISVIVPCTVIYQNDAAHKITDRELHPEYHGIRTKMVESFPENKALWDKYAEILHDSMRNDGDESLATQFYEENRAAMDDGAAVTWPERFGQGEISAIQHAMNLLIRDEAAFWSEMQNEPLDASVSDDIMASKADILAKITDYRKFVCPKDTTCVTAFIDVQMKALYWMLVAWEPDFSGQIIEYGTWPEQDRRRSFALQGLRQTFDTELPGKQLEAQIFAGLKALVADLSRPLYPVDGNSGKFGAETILVDANWGQQTNTVYTFCRECNFGPKVIPSHGKYVGASSQPWSQWKRKAGERIGPHWRLRPSAEWPIKHVLVDTNYWKTFVHQRLKADFGASSSINLYGRTVNDRRLEARYHSELADQLVAEFPVRVEVKDKVVHEWKLRPHHPDNHFLDCLVGCAVAASMNGVELAGSRIPQKASRVSMKSFKDAYLRNMQS